MQQNLRKEQLMLKQSIAFFLSLVLIFNGLVCIEPANATSISSRKKLEFSDTDNFYKDLVVRLRDGQALDIATKYDDYSDFPPRLKQIFRSDLLEASQLSKRSIQATLDPEPLKIFATTALGCGIGAGVGGVFCGILAFATQGTFDYSTCVDPIMNFTTGRMRSWVCICCTQVSLWS